MTSANNFESFNNQNNRGPDEAGDALRDEFAKPPASHAPETQKEQTAEVKPAEVEAAEQQIAVPEAKKEIEEMTPSEHLKAITTALGNASRLYDILVRNNQVPAEWQNPVATANFESAVINPHDLGDPKKIHGLLANLDRAVNGNV